MALKSFVNFFILITVIKISSQWVRKQLFSKKNETSEKNIYTKTYLDEEKKYNLTIHQNN